MTEPNENILRRVRALLDRAEHERTPAPEREAAMAKATELMAQYGIQRAMLAAVGSIDDPIDVTKIVITDPYSYEKASLLVAVVKPLGCRTAAYMNGRRVDEIAVVGSASDRERAEMLYTSLLLQAERGMLSEVPRGYDAADTRNARAAYLAGFASRIHTRLTEAEARAARDFDAQHTTVGSHLPGTALVLADRKALVERRFAELFGEVKKRRTRLYNGQDFDRGDAAGRRADIGTMRVSGAGTRRVEGARR